MPHSRRHLLFLLSSVLLGLVSFSLIEAVARYSLDSANIAASQIILVPFVTLGLILLDRQEIFRSVRWSPVWGGAVVAVGVAGRVLMDVSGGGFAAVDAMAGRAASIVVVWLGIFLAFYGTRAFRRGLFPLLFLFFAVPIPLEVVDGIVAFLQRGSAEATYVIVRATGTPVFRDGFVFALPGLVVEIAPECSGIRSSIGMLIVGLLAGHMMLRSVWAKSVFVVAAIGVAILKNAIRINTLTLLSVYVDPGIIEGRLHHEGGVAFFAIGLVLLYPVLMLLARAEKPATHTDSADVPPQAPVHEEAVSDSGQVGGVREISRT